MCTLVCMHVCVKEEEEGGGGRVGRRGGGEGKGGGGEVRGGGRGGSLHSMMFYLGLRLIEST